MTRDTGGLRQFLRIALALGASACTTASTDAPPAKAADARAAISRPAPDAARAPAPDAAPPVDAAALSPDAMQGHASIADHQHFSCPSGSWCGPAASAKKVAVEGTGHELGCVDEFDGDPGTGSYMNASLDVSATKAKRKAGDKQTCCYTWVQPCGGGRALRDGERIVVAEAEAVSGTLAAAWLADALAEHASIASFARTTIELMAVGAPPALLADVQRAALDEIRHAERCFALASRYAGRALEPGPLEALAPRASELARLAHDTFVEGCAGETIAALAATRALAACDDPEVAAVLRQIVDDETRHAALAWRTLAWLLERGGAPVREALAAITAPPMRAGAHDPRLARHGRLDDAALARAEHDAWHEIILPTLAELLA